MARRLDPEDAAKVMRAAGLEPLVPYPGAAASWPSRCLKCDKTSTTSLAKIKGGRGPCKWCAPNGPVDPEEARQVALGRQLEPLAPYPGRNNVPWLCRCLVCGSEVTPFYSNVQQPGGSRGCQTCKSATLRSLRLAETPVDQAVREMRAVGLEPLAPFPGTNTSWLCRCTKCGKETSPSLSHIRRPGRGPCKWCAYNAPVDPEAARSVMLRARLEPLVSFPGANVPWACRCLDCGASVAPTYSTVRAGGGCRGCARTGFNPNDPAVVYLVRHAVHGAIKVGIGNSGGDRVARHRKRGWEVLAVVHMPGHRAPVVERAILNWWRKDLGLPVYLSEVEMPHRGWTETVATDAIDVPDTIARIRSLAFVKIEPVSA